MCKSTRPRSEWKPHKAHGYCDTHYRQWLNTKPYCKADGCKVRTGVTASDSRQGYCRRHDWLLLGEPFRKAAAVDLTKNKFAAQIAPVTNDRGCWLWEGRFNANGYALINVGNNEWLAHRYSYGSFVGGHEPRLTLDHVCRTRRCVRPDHLMPMTLRRNTAFQHKDNDDLDVILGDLTLLPDMSPGVMLWAMVKRLAVGRAQPGERSFGFGLDGQPFEHNPGPAKFPAAVELLKAPRSFRRQ